MGVKPERVSVIRSGIKPLDTSLVKRDDVRKELGLDPTDIFLLAVGRLMVQKGHDVFIQAVSRIVEHYPGVMAGICGDGSLRPQLESQIDALGLSDHMKLLGMRGDISPFLSAADIFVLPSRWEGLSRALWKQWLQVFLPCHAGGWSSGSNHEWCLHGLLDTRQPRRAGKVL
jgi:glycosyltransferase involved in cell wall biosynthesis